MEESEKRRVIDEMTKWFLQINDQRINKNGNYLKVNVFKRKQSSDDGTWVHVLGIVRVCRVVSSSKALAPVIEMASFRYGWARFTITISADISGCGRVKHIGLTRANLNSQMISDYSFSDGKDQPVCMVHFLIVPTSISWCHQINESAYSNHFSSSRLNQIKLASIEIDRPCIKLSPMP